MYIYIMHTCIYIYIHIYNLCTYFNSYNYSYNKYKYIHTWQQRTTGTTKPNSPTCSVPSCSFANSLDPTTSWREDHFQCSKMFKWLNMVSTGLQQASHAWLALIGRNNTCTSNHFNAYAATWQWISLDLGRCKSVKFSTTSVCVCVL